MHNYVPAMKIINRLQLAWARRQQRREIGRQGWSGVYVGDYVRPPTWGYTIGFGETRCTTQRSWSSMADS